MALFEKKNCSRCGKELGLIFGKHKIADGTICKDCNALLSPLLSNKSKLSLAEIEKHIEYRNKNKLALSSFKATTILGNNTKFYFDDSQNKFLVSDSKDFVSKNIDVLSISEVSSAQVIKDESEEEIFKEDSEGNEISYNPKRYEYYVEYTIEVTLNNKWIKELNVNMTQEPINRNDSQAILDTENLANEICAKLLNTTYTAKTSTSSTSTNASWICSNCGKENDSAIKFCPECGTAKPAGAKYCSECGTKLDSNVKFCPNCGKAVN